MDIDFPDIIFNIERDSIRKKALIASMVFTLILEIIAFSAVLVYVDKSFVTEYDNKTIMVFNPRKFDDTVTNQLRSKYDKRVKIYDSSELSVEKIENRSNDILVERCISYVENFKDGNGSGTILNCFAKDFSYIHFEDNIDPIYKGTIVVSYFVYNPDSKYVDDVIDVYDFVISRNYEE